MQYIIHNEALLCGKTFIYLFDLKSEVCKIKVETCKLILKSAPDWLFSLVWGLFSPLPP